MSTVGGSSLATLRGSPSSVMTSPRGASRNAICSSSWEKDDCRSTAALCASIKEDVSPTLRRAPAHTGSEDVPLPSLE